MIHAGPVMAHKESVCAEGCDCLRHTEPRRPGRPRPRSDWAVQVVPLTAKRISREPRGDQPTAVPCRAAAFYSKVPFCVLPHGKSGPHVGPASLANQKGAAWSRTVTVPSPFLAKEMFLKTTFRKLKRLSGDGRVLTWCYRKVRDLLLHKRTAALNRGLREGKAEKRELAIRGRQLLRKVSQPEGLRQTQQCTRYRSLASILTWQSQRTINQRHISHTTKQNHTGVTWWFSVLTSVTGVWINVRAGSVRLTSQDTQNCHACSFISVDNCCIAREDRLSATLYKNHRMKIQNWSWWKIRKLLSAKHLRKYMSGPIPHAHDKLLEQGLVCKNPAQIRLGNKSSSRKMNTDRIQQLFFPRSSATVSHGGRPKNYGIPLSISGAIVRLWHRQSHSEAVFEIQAESVHTSMRSSQIG